MKPSYCFAIARVSCRLSIPLLISAVFACVLMQSKVQAQSILWNGAVTAGPHAWNLATNWTGTDVPDTNAEIGDLQKDWTAAATINFSGSTTLNGVIYNDAGTSGDVAMILASSPTTAVVTLAGTSPAIQVTGTMSINSPVGGTTAWRKTGGGVLVLNGTNTFNTGVIVADGTLRLGTVAASAGAGGNFTVTNGENPAASNTNALELAGGFSFGTGRAVTLSNTSTSNIANARTALINQSGNNTWAGSIVLAGGANQTIQSSTGTFTITGNITNGVNPPTSFLVRGTGAVALAGTINVGGTALLKTDSGTWTISSTGNVHGNVTLANGGITVNNDHALHPRSVVTFGEGNANTGTLTINPGRVQALGGFNLAPTTTTANGHRVIGAGTLEFGWPSKTVDVVDAPAADDLTIATAISGPGGFTKTGPGRLVVNGASVRGPANVTTGSLAAQSTFNGGITMGAGTLLIVSNLGTVGTLITPTLAFAAGFTTLEMDAGEGAADLIQVTSPGGLTQAGSTTINIGTAGGFDVGVYPLISYTGASPGTGGFVLGTKPDTIAAAALIDTGTAIALNVTAVGKLLWTGEVDANWDLTTPNWDTIGGAPDVAFGSEDDVVFGDGPASTMIALVGTIDPQRVGFTADTTAYTLASGTLSGAVGMELVKSGDGNVILRTANTYNGLTDIQAGTLELDHDGGTLTATSGVVVGPAATFRITDDDGAITFNRSLSGSGTVEVNPHSIIGTATAQNVTFSAASPGFSGNLILESPLSGSSRLSASAAAVGASTITVEDENQLFCTNGNTYANSITITGDGFNDASSSIGAIRLEGATWNGAITISGTAGDSGGTAYDARIGSAANNSTINGSLSGGDLGFWSADNASCAAFLTAANSFGDLIIGGSSGSAAGGGQAFVTIGANQGIPTNTTATLGSGDVYLFSGTNATDPQNSVLRFNRANGYTLAAGQEITGSAANALQWGGVLLHVDTVGTGFNTGANTINLANAGLTEGGLIRVGTLTNGAILNIDAGATIKAGGIHVGEADNNGNTVNQEAGSTVSLTNQLRIGHFASETSVYHLAGGSITMTGASPAVTPSTSDATEQNGGIYVGISGQGILNQTGGTVSTNFVLLDNRTNNGAGANMPTGIDQYNLTAGSLALKSNWGIIQRNPSSEFNLGGGTISIDNTGTGTGTGPALTIPLDTLINVSGTASVLETVAATNSFSLTRNVLGGTLTLIGGGDIKLNPATPQTITTVLAGTTNPVVKIGPSTSTLTATNTYLTATTVEAGTLNIAGSLNNSDVSVLDAATIGGEGSVKSLVLGTTTGSNLLIDGGTAGALTVHGALVHNGTTTVDFSGTPTGNAVTVLNYGSGAPGTYALANAANYRSSSFSDSGSVVTLNLDLKNLTWTGTDIGSLTAWDINGAENWSDGAARKFFNGDSVTFNDTPGVNQTVNITGNVQPEAVTVNNTAIEYTIAGAGGIGGSASVTKSGTSTLTLGGANTMAGPIQVNAGILKAANVAAFGTSSGITVASGGQVNLNGTSFGNTRSYSYTIAGDGGDGRGAIINEIASVAANAAVANLTLTGNASVGAYGGTGDGNRFDIGYNGTVFGAINGGGFTLTKVGDAMINVRTTSSDITYVVSAGTLRAENSPQAFGSNPVTVNGGRLDTFGSLSFANPLVFATGTRLTSSDGTGTWTGGMSITGDVTFGGTHTINVASVITGGGSMIKTDAGTLILSAANSYNGTTTLNAGALQANHAGAFHGSTVNITNSVAAGRLVVNGGVTLPIDITVGSGPVITGAVGLGLLESTGTGQGIYSGTITINSAPSAGGTLRGGTSVGNELVFTGPVNIAAGIAFNQSDGRVIFSGGGTSTGSTFTTTGTTLLGANEGMPSGLTLSMGGSGAATFEMNGFSQTLAGLIRVTTNAATVTNSAVAPSTLNLNIASGSPGFTGVISGNLELVKLGAGTQVLPLSNSYTGATTVSAGALRVGNFSGSATGTGTVTVGAGGTLEGTGIIGGAVVVNGLVTPGVADTGTLTMNGNVAFNSGSILKIGINDASAPKWDVLAVVGSLSATGATLDFDVSGALADPVHVVATYTGGAPAGFTALDVPAGYVVDYDYNGNSIALLNAYLGWAAENGLTPGVNDGKLHDPDNDGVTNVLEFATDGDPLSGEGNAKVRSIITDVDSGAPVAQALTITLPVRTGAVFSGPGDQVSASVDGIVYTIQSGTDLSDFTTPNVTEVTDNAAILTQLSLPALSSPGWSYRTFRAPGTPGTDVREFLRVVAE